jgi:hypothetical protein
VKPITLQSRATPYVPRQLDEGVSAMTGRPWNRKILTLTLAALTCAAVAVSMSFAYPTQVASPMLGVGWQCHRAVGILTTCSRVSHVVPMNDNRARIRATDIRRV